RPWDHPAPRMGADGPYMIYDDDFLAALERQRNDWQAEMGFQPRTIKVKAFFDADYSVGVELLPDHYQGLETADWFDDEDERREFMKSRDEWVKRGNFVWWWARDYHMSKNGKVEST
ncbi:MAG TPA: hypothetical protein VFE78_01020, partial [Gemmataceae bacterium]|nr:hypothetical protein [Gemmataceae bacterium]